MSDNSSDPLRTHDRWKPRLAVVLFFLCALVCVAQSTNMNCTTLELCRDYDAAFIKGFNYETGAGGIHPDYDMAVRWYTVAALHGHPGAQNNLGVLYLKGKGVPQDYAESTRWYRLSANQGFPRAQAMLGLAYLLGEGVLEDYDAAAEWCTKAAKQGDDTGEGCLGFLYEDGHGVPQDYVQAHMWLNLSSAQGNVEARKARDKIATKMTPGQIAEAQRLAREFKQSDSSAPLDNAEVIHMVRTGFKEDTLIWVIGLRPAHYSLSQVDRAALRAAGVSEAVIQAMADKSAGR